MRRILRGLFRAAIVVVLILVAVAVAEQVFFEGVGPFTTDAVGIVFLEGEIEGSDEVVEALDRLRSQDGVRAVVLRIDSPGGAVAPSQEIYDAVVRLRETKPVIASLGNIAASGGYYVAAACQRVVANAGTLTGSIGVLMQLGNIQGLLEKIGVAGVVLKAGRYKDVGSPIRPMSDEERRLMEGVLVNVHEQFINAVAKGRGLAVEDVRKVADGRILTGEQALEVKLVDSLGGLSEAVALAAKEAGIEGEPTRLEFREQEGDWWWEQVIRSLLASGSDGTVAVNWVYEGLVPTLK